MELKDIKAVYFVGAGGIGMSALARYFLHRHLVVAGYDRTPTPLTHELEREGMQIHYEEDVDQIPAPCRDREHTLVVFTPAIPASHAELAWFKEHDFTIEKRAQVLGTLTRTHKGLCFAGTHGKTTTSTMCAHIMSQSHIGCNAFLGGISKNVGSNYILSLTSDYVVIEADEFDRSFHWLRPWMSVITSTDPDHLDIYGTKEAYLESFRHYTELIQPGGALILHTGLEMKAHVPEGVKTYTYSRDEGDFHAANIRIGDGKIVFDFVSPLETVTQVSLGHPVPINIENSVAAMAMAQLNGCTAEELRRGMETYAGVERRFDFKINNPHHVFLSDYGHHPKEILQCAKSLRELYAHRKLTVIFQPHLYTRTRDFYADFADALSHFDEVVLTEIYPAREQPIEGVTSKLIYDHLREGVERTMIAKHDVAEWVRSRDFDVLVVLGAGDLNDYVPEITRILEEKEKAYRTTGRYRESQCKLEARAVCRGGPDTGRLPRHGRDVVEHAGLGLQGLLQGGCQHLRRQQRRIPERRGDQAYPHAAGPLSAWQTDSGDLSTIHRGGTPHQSLCQYGGVSRHAERTRHDSPHTARAHHPHQEQQGRRLLHRRQGRTDAQLQIYERPDHRHGPHQPILRPQLPHTHGQGHHGL